jgi:hypothetical protein
MNSSSPCGIASIAPCVQTEIDEVANVFDQAIKANIQITIIKTESGSEKSAARHRPKIG